MAASIRGTGSMFRSGSSFEYHDDTSKDSAIGDCSNDSSCSSISSGAAAGPTDFAAMMVGRGAATAASTTGNTQILSRKMASMSLKKGKNNDVRRGDILALEEEKEDEDGGITVDAEDDENARDSSFVKMPPPSYVPSIVARRPFGDISNRTESPLSMKSFARNATTSIILPSSMSTGGLRSRNRKRSNYSTACPSPLGAGKRWRVTESIDEHSETPSTSFAARTLSVDSRSETIDRSPDENTVPCARTFHRVQSTSVLEKGIYAPHHDENVPAHLDVFYSLPTLETVDSQAFRRIDGATLAYLMRTLGDAFEQSYALIDCRYPYEYEGGHIKSATNVFNPDLIYSRFFAPSTSLLAKKEEKKKIPIFYCEFSQKRGPNMAAAVRALDRVRNQLAYPHVDHAEMYVLNGGYNGFHEKHGCVELCTPHAYTRMDDDRFTRELKKFVYHKKSFSACSTVSRLPPPTTMAAKQAAREQSSCGSPTFAPPRAGIERKPSRRALYKDSPTRPQVPIVNPKFS